MEKYFVLYLPQTGEFWCGDGTWSQDFRDAYLYHFLDHTRAAQHNHRDKKTVVLQIGKEID